MGLSAALTAGSLVLGAVSSFAQSRQVAASQAARRDAIRQNQALRARELTRRQERVNEVAEEKKSDVVRQAESQLGAVRAVAGDIGATSTAFTRMVAEIGGAEGRDKGRIEANRKARNESIQAQKEADVVEFNNSIEASFNRESAANTSAILGFAGNALQIGADHVARNRREKILENRTE